MKWISVQDELPNFYFDVIVCDKHGYVMPAFFDDDGHWQDSTQSNYILTGITHWMPLPQPPKTN